jgi:ABC-type Fe3+-hydroxamate transport system substrate-binding protein
VSRVQITIQPQARATAIFLVVVLLAFLSCARTPTREANGPAPERATRSLTDEAGRAVFVPERVGRVVSLAPNLTEIVYAIGAGSKLVGDTTYCDFPPAAKEVAKVGDTLHPNVERILTLRPQVVLVSTASQLEAFANQLTEQRIAVYVTDPHDLEGIFRSIQNLGSLLDQETQAAALTASLRQRAEAVQSAVQRRRTVRVFYQLSAEPLYTAGRDSFITDLIRRAGGESVTADVPGAWPRYSAEAALAAQADVIILPTGGSMGSANAEPAEPLRRTDAVLNRRVYKINDDLLARPGPRLVDGLEQLAHALHPEAFAQ